MSNLMREALQAIIEEVEGPLSPYSADSYLPAHLIEQARTAVAEAGSDDPPQFVAIIEQRAELLSALEGVLPFLTGDYWPGVESDAAVDRAVAVVQKAGFAAQMEPIQFITQTTVANPEGGD